uniref:T-complex protein delta SU n=1 Tax=Amorphochlora amoebiformis TaxID=1561963 RepID=A0A0H5BR27_9EUKA|nr:T-complex protein delta SU [Amorphochlora amoebiformis]
MLETNLKIYYGIFTINQILKKILGPNNQNLIVLDRQNLIISKKGMRILNIITGKNKYTLIIKKYSTYINQKFGDGIKSFVIISTEIIKNLLFSNHPILFSNSLNSIFRFASVTVAKTINYFSFNLGDEIKELSLVWWLYCMAKTSLSHYNSTNESDYITKICLLLVIKTRIPENLKQVKLLKITEGTIKESYIEEGIIITINNNYYRDYFLENPKILFSKHLIISKFSSKDIFLKNNNGLHLSDNVFFCNNKKIMEIIKKTVTSGINYIVSMQIINSKIVSALKKCNILFLDNVFENGYDKLSIIMSWNNQWMQNTTERLMVVKNAMLFMANYYQGFAIICKPLDPMTKISTIIIRGNSNNSVDELRRHIIGALKLLYLSISDCRFILANGYIEQKIIGQLLLANDKIKHNNRIVLKIIVIAIRNFLTSLYKKDYLKIFGNTSDSAKKNILNVKYSTYNVVYKRIMNNYLSGYYELSLFKQKIFIESLKVVELMIRFS